MAWLRFGHHGPIVVKRPMGNGCCRDCDATIALVDSGLRARDAMQKESVNNNQHRSCDNFPNFQYVGDQIADNFLPTNCSISNSGIMLLHRPLCYQQHSTKSPKGLFNYWHYLDDFLNEKQAK